MAAEGRTAARRGSTRSAYTRTNLASGRPAAGRGEPRWPAARSIGPVELTLDESGARFIAFCNSAGEMRAATDRSGTWRVTPLTPAPCLGALDALLANGRLIAAYRSTGGQLRVASFETSGL